MKLALVRNFLFFSRNTSLARRQEILTLSGLTETTRFDTYLGLLVLVGISIMQSFNGIIDRIWKRLNNWKVKFLSQAGKEIFLKAVVQAISTFSMSVFLLPVTLCKDLNHMMQKFWW
jgi:hypothetical protein